MDDIFDLSPRLNDVVNERIKAIEKGYGADHDDEHGHVLLMLAAKSLIDFDDSTWPFEQELFERYIYQGLRARVIIACSFMVAAVEVMDRAIERRKNNGR